MINPKVVIAANQVAAFAFVGLAAWKGPHVAGAVYGGLAACFQLASTLVALGVIPQKDAEYIDALEAVVEKHAPADVAEKVIKP